MKLETYLEIKENLETEYQKHQKEKIEVKKRRNMFRRPGSTAFYKEKKQNNKIEELEKTNEKLTKLVSKLATLVGTLNLKEKEKERLNEVKSDLRKLMDGGLDE